MGGRHLFPFEAALEPARLRCSGRVASGRGGVEAQGHLGSRCQARERPEERDGPGRPITTLLSTYTR